MIYSSLFGMAFDSQGLRFSPVVPRDWGTVQLTGLHYRSAILNIRHEGSGCHTARVLLDGQPVQDASIPAGTTGTHDLVITVKQ